MNKVEVARLIGKEILEDCGVNFDDLQKVKIDPREIKNVNQTPFLKKMALFKDKSCIKLITEISARDVAFAKNQSKEDKIYLKELFNIVQNLDLTASVNSLEKSEWDHYEQDERLAITNPMSLYKKVGGLKTNIILSISAANNYETHYDALSSTHKKDLKILAVVLFLAPHLESKIKETSPNFIQEIISLSPDKALRAKIALT